MYQPNDGLFNPKHVAILEEENVCCVLTRVTIYPSQEERTFPMYLT